MTTPSSAPSAITARTTTLVIAALLALAACSDNGILEPSRTNSPFASRPNAAIVETANHSAYSTRAEFSGAGIVAQASDFELYSGELVYELPTPWTSNGITYTSGHNIILGPGVGLGVQSNGMSADFGAPLSGQFAPEDAFTIFGTDIALVGVKAPIGLVITTNLASYSFGDLDVPLASDGAGFFGLALSQPGEYLTGFRFTNSNGGTTLLLDNLAVGHVGAVNAAPVASAGGPYAGAEGSSVTLSLSAVDTDTDALTYSWDLGDGTTGSGNAPPASHVYADNGHYAIMLAVADGRGGVDTARTTAAISNVAPTLSAFAVPTTPVALASGGATISVAASFSDPGNDTHLVALDCGVGAATQSPAPNGTAGGQCTFASPGVYAVQLTVVDDDGDSDAEMASGQVVVYDASAGSITGGGWINSPWGAYTPAASVTGKLTFGFVAKYQSSSVAIPSGNAEFKLNLAKLDFRSTTLDWLVVGGTMARLQGSGTLNGVSGYGFSIVARDAVADAVRIRIWNRVTGLVVYDNLPGLPGESDDVTPLGGGSIQLHSK